jgi:hypothetical protein
VSRAKIILLSASGKTNLQIARQMGLTNATETLDVHIIVDNYATRKHRGDLVQPDYAAGHSSRDISQRQGTGRENRSIRSNLQQPRAAIRPDRHRGFDLR